MPLSTDTILAALRHVKHPRTGADIVAMGCVRDVAVAGSEARFTLALPPPAGPLQDQVRMTAEAVARAIPGVTGVAIQVTTAVPGARPAEHEHEDEHAHAHGHDHGHEHGQDHGHDHGHGHEHAPGAAPAGPPIARVQHVIAVGAGKGGVGKSTVAANLAVALAARGRSVGLLDADVYGPSIPMMMGITWRATGEGPLEPPVAHGVKVISLGFFLEDPEQPVIWRGPMIHKTVTQFLGGVRWGTLDYLVVDLPPGTGDVQLTLAQAVPISGGVVVCTPQDVALLDARKAVRMFQKLNAPVLGMVENMSGFVCGHCHKRTDIFGAGAVRRAADKMGVPFLGAIPLDARVSVSGDAGTPAVAQIAKSDPVGAAFLAVADALEAQVATRRQSRAAPAAPKITR